LLIAVFAGQPALAPSFSMRRGADALATSQDLSGYLLHLLAASLCVALLVAAFVQFLAPLTYALGQRLGVASWLRRTAWSMGPFLSRHDGGPNNPGHRHPAPGWLRRALDGLGVVGISGDRLFAEALRRIEAGRAELEKSSSRTRWMPFPWFATPKIEPRSYGSLTRVGASDEAFMFGVQGDLRAAVASPVAKMPLFLLATAGMSHRYEVTPLVVIDLLTTRRPEVMVKLAEVSGALGEGMQASPFAAAISGAIAALDELAAKTAERNLDDLQRSLARFGAWSARVLAILLGLVTAFVAQWLLGVRPDPTSLSVGLSGGVLAILLRDGLAVLAARSSR
jgi:hypothetical protein